MSPRLIGSQARRLASFAGVALEQLGELTGRVSQLALDLAGLLHTRENSDRLRDEPSAGERTAAGARSPEAERRRAGAPAGNGRSDAPARPAPPPPAAPASPPGPPAATAPSTESASDDRASEFAAATADAAPQPEEELVAESADPGAVEGAGPSITIDPPWPGYDSMRAPDVIGHAETVDAAQLAVAELYERAHKNRTTVLDALERRLARTRQAG